MILIGCNGFLVKMNVLDAIVGSGEWVGGGGSGGEPTALSCGLLYFPTNPFGAALNLPTICSEVDLVV